MMELTGDVRAAILRVLEEYRPEAGNGGEGVEQAPERSAQDETEAGVTFTSTTARGLNDHHSGPGDPRR